MPEPSSGDVCRVAAVCLSALAASAVLEWLRSDAYEVVLGVTNPVASTAAVVGLGLAGWVVLVRMGWTPAKDGRSRGRAVAVTAGLALPVPVIIIDCLGGFPKGINAPFPDAIVFYPSIAVVAEFVFHVAPLAIAAVLATLIRLDVRTFEVAGLAAAVVIEPILQVAWGIAGVPSWVNAYAGLHLLVFNALGVYLLCRHGLLLVFLYRLSYYVVWHIGWGYIRLQLLFSA